MTWYCGSLNCSGAHISANEEDACNPWILPQLSEDVGPKINYRYNRNVRVIQGALNRFHEIKGGPSVKLLTDGKCGKKTLDAIYKFQSFIVRNEHLSWSPDYQIERGKDTWRRLASWRHTSAPTPSHKNILPPFLLMWNNYPIIEKSQVLELVGGTVFARNPDNSCVIRLSRAFNYAGDPIIRGFAGIYTLPGADGFQYGVRVAEMEEYLRRKYGEPAVQVSSTDASVRKAAVTGLRGVIQFNVHFPSGSKATGHMDIWDMDKARYHSYFNRAYEVLLWTCT